MDWQKLDAIKRFARSRLTYLLQNMEPSISWAMSIDRETRSLAKKQGTPPPKSYHHLRGCHTGLEQTEVYHKPPPRNCTEPVPREMEAVLGPGKSCHLHISPSRQQSLRPHRSLHKLWGIPFRPQGETQPPPHTHIKTQG